MSNMFRLNKSLVHCDFSNCGFSKSECKIMSKGLNENHTILGLHMIGNKMNTSPLGFLKEDDGNPGASHILAHVANKDLKADKSKLKFQYNITSNCWICERWVEIKVIFDPAKCHHPLESQISERDRMLIHFSFENFEPDVLFKDEETGLYCSERMVPPTEIYYYVTINNHAKYSTDQPSVHFEFKKKLDIDKVNYINLSSESNRDLSSSYFESKTCYPRPERPVFIFEEDPEPEPEWNFKDSIFYGYIPDSDALLQKCFEYDWSFCKIPKIIKNKEELAKVKEYLQSKYKYIRETYKYHAGISPCTFVPSIGQNAFNEIINLTTIVDGNTCKLSDIDFEFIATKAGNKKVFLNPERWLVRYQFMEIFIRIALHKYFKPQVNLDIEEKITESDAVK